MPKSTKQTINEIQARTQSPLISRPPPLNEAFLHKWLCLQTKNHPKLEELKSLFNHLTASIWANPTFGKLIVLAGPNGTGKTHFAKSIKSWIDSTGHSKHFRSNGPYDWEYLRALMEYWPETLDYLKSGHWDSVSYLSEIPVLILDDIGSAHDPSEIGTDKLCQILSKRLNRWTLITTNFPPKEWPTKFDSRVASRLLRNSIIVDLSDVPDFNA